MTYTEFVEECCTIRNNRMIRTELDRRLQVLNKLKYDTLVNITDPAREHLQRSITPDSKMINTLSEYDRKRERIEAIVDNLPAESKEVKELIYSTLGLEPELVRLYVIEALPMKDIAKRLGYNPTYCYTKYKQGLKRIYRNYERRLQDG